MIQTITVCSMTTFSELKVQQDKSYRYEFYIDFNRIQCLKRLERLVKQNANLELVKLKKCKNQK